VCSSDLAYTFIANDIGKRLQKTAADTAVRTWTIPLNSSVAYPVGTVIYGDNFDDNNLTIVADSTATLMEFNGGTPVDGNVVVGEGESFTLHQYAIDTWTIVKNRPGGAITNYVSGMRSYTHINGAESVSFAVSTQIAESTWASVGPTGSGATHIWTALNSIPAGAKTIKIKVYLSVTDDGAGAGSVYIYGRQNGQSGSFNTQRIICSHRTGAVSIVSTIQSIADVPIDNSSIFDTAWLASNDTARVVSIYLMGFTV